MRKGDIWLLLPDMAELRKGSSSFSSSFPFSSSSASALMHPRIPWVFLGFPPTGTSTERGKLRIGVKSVSVQMGYAIAGRTGEPLRA
ncbi:MAG TPA: hypothetical protein VHD63_25135, partial [Ktedonobacteraceae bacterium]|nr:hypothetical protein [Ktedonobacteraceae bacterium]